MIIFPPPDFSLEQVNVYVFCKIEKSSYLLLSGGFNLKGNGILSAIDYSQLSIAFITEKYFWTNLLDNREFISVHKKEFQKQVRNIKNHTSGAKFNTGAKP